MTDFVLRKLRLLWHFVFWGAAFFVLMAIFSGPGNFDKIDIIYTLLFMIPLVGGVYLNIYLLVPLLLKNERYLLFLLAFIATSFVTSLFIYKFFDSWVDLILKNYYFIAYDDLSILLLYSFAFLSLSTMFKLSKEWILNLRKEKEEKNIQLKGLQAQINPHFLLNSLHTIYSQSLDQAEETSDTILRLSEILKYTLYETEMEEIDLEREIDIINEYITMQRLRSDEDRVKIEFKVSGEPQRHKVIPMLFIPFIENSFKHGLQGNEKSAWVKINIHCESKSLSFQIENNTGQFDRKEKKLYSGIGIENTRKRLELFYPGKHKLIIEQDKGLFRVILNLDLRS